MCSVSIKGETGATGERGFRGRTGATGSTGIPGSRGLHGIPPIYFFMIGINGWIARFLYKILYYG